MAEYLSNAYKEERAETAENGAITATRAVHMATPRTPQAYANIANTQRAEQSLVPPPWLVLKWISVHGLNGEQRAEFSTGEGVRIRIGFEGLVDPASTYFCILINNSAQERMTTIYSTDNGSISTKSSGVVECTIPELMLGVGLYNLGIDCGTYDVELSAYVCRESVPFATFIRVKDNGSLQGVVRTEFQGVVHRTEWSTLEPAADNLFEIGNQRGQSRRESCLTMLQHLRGRAGIGKLGSLAAHWSARPIANIDFHRAPWRQEDENYHLQFGGTAGARLADFLRSHLVLERTSSVKFSWAADAARYGLVSLHCRGSIRGERRWWCRPIAVRPSFLPSSRAGSPPCSLIPGRSLFPHRINMQALWATMFLPYSLSISVERGFPIRRGRGSLGFVAPAAYSPSRTIAIICGRWAANLALTWRCTPSDLEKSFPRPQEGH